MNLHSHHRNSYNNDIIIKFKVASNYITPLQSFMKIYEMDSEILRAKRGRSQDNISIHSYRCRQHQSVKITKLMFIV
jgi:hypothetical protein